MSTNSIALAARDDVIGSLYDAADDYQIAELDVLCVKAGLRWYCDPAIADEGCGWMNVPEDVQCYNCGLAHSAIKAVGLS